MDESGELFIVDDWIWGALKGVFTGHNIWKSANQQAKNAAMIWGGLFTLDANKNFFKKTWELLSRFTWQGFQTWIGFGVAHFVNSFSYVSQVCYKYGTTVLSSSMLKETQAFTIGNYMTGSEEIKADPNDIFFQHEYGHYLQSQSMGPLYMFFVGIPSYIGHSDLSGDHSYKNVERDASWRAFNYFSKHIDGYNTQTDATQGWNFIHNPIMPRQTFCIKIDYNNDKQMSRAKSSISNFYRSFHF